MGLDMWMYGIKDISNDEIPDNMPESWYEEHGYEMIEHYEDDNDFDNMYHDIYDYSVIRNVEYTETDFEKIKEDYNVNKDAHVSMLGSGGVIGFSCRNYYKEVKISEDELNKYDKKVFRKSLVYKADELAYWRKEYDLQDLIYNEYCGQVYNCGFHRLNNEMMRKINRYLRVRNMDKQSINNDGYIAKMYYEWY